MDNAMNKPTNQVLSAPASEQDFVAKPSPSSSSLLNVGFGAALSREIDGVLWVKADDHTYAVDKVHLAWQQRINELEKIIAATTVEQDAISAARYRWWRVNIDSLLEDEDGLQGMAFSYQVQLNDIDKPSADLMDIVAEIGMKIEPIEGAQTRMLPTLAKSASQAHRPNEK